MAIRLLIVLIFFVCGCESQSKVSTSKVKSPQKGLSKVRKSSGVMLRWGVSNDAGKSSGLDRWFITGYSIDFEKCRPKTSLSGIRGALSAKWQVSPSKGSEGPRFRVTDLNWTGSLDSIKGCFSKILSKHRGYKDSQGNSANSGMAGGKWGQARVQQGSLVLSFGAWDLPKKTYLSSGKHILWNSGDRLRGKGSKVYE